MHLDQMREFPFAAASVLGPEIDDDDFTLIASNHPTEIAILHGSQRDIGIARVARRGRPKTHRAQGQGYHDRSRARRTRHRKTSCKVMALPLS
jgi:hypothetical protein